jgi:phosphatidylethanolamine/phosphatidyl-N-methylethanolamine N-methyltransferase
VSLDQMNTQTATHTSQNYKVFLSAMLRQPAVVGAMAPSSSALADCMASVVSSTGDPVVVELGAGTGPVSAAIQRRLPAGARHLAVEVDDEMVEYLRQVQPAMEVVHGNAENLTELLAEREVGQADAVVSALPWSLFRSESQRRILGQIGEVLAPGGAFTTVTYVHSRMLAGGRRFDRLVREAFDEVIVSQAVWRNFPPAKVYVCRRPARSG